MFGSGRKGSRAQRRENAEAERRAAHHQYKQHLNDLATETAGQRQWRIKWEKACCSWLTEGSNSGSVAVHKYAFGKSKREKVSVFVDKERQELRWKGRFTLSSYKSSFALADVQQILLGHLSESFRRQAITVDDPANCVSLVTPTRSYDFAFADSNDSRRFLTAIQSLATSLPRTKRVRPGQLLWSIARLKVHTAADKACESDVKALTKVLLASASSNV
jgi:hypothetical protein